MHLREIDHIKAFSSQNSKMHRGKIQRSGTLNEWTWMNEARSSFKGKKGSNQCKNWTDN